MSKREYENWKEFFEKCGDNYIKPTSFGECLWPVTVEEMFIHFRNRIIVELETEHGDLLRQL